LRRRRDFGLRDSEAKARRGSLRRRVSRSRPYGLCRLRGVRRGDGLRRITPRPSSTGSVVLGLAEHLTQGAALLRAQRGQALPEESVAVPVNDRGDLIGELSREDEVQLIPGEGAGLLGGSRQRWSGLRFCLPGTTERFVQQRLDRVKAN